VTASIGGIGPLPASTGSRPVAPGSSFTYVLTARVPGGSATKTLAQVRVTVLPPPENFRQVVVIDSYNQQEQFIQAIATPNTTRRRTRDVCSSSASTPTPTTC
jgi:hypothetical protein